MVNKNLIETYKSEDLNTSVDRYERSFKFVENNAGIVLSTSEKGLETLANAAVNLAGIYKDLKQMEYSFQMYMENSKNNLIKIEAAKKILDGVSKRMDKITDQIISGDLKTMNSKQIRFRTELLNSLNKQNDVILNLMINVFNC